MPASSEAPFAENELLPVLVIGAGAAGLSTAAALARRGIDSLVVDQDSEIGGTWLRRYDALHLHTTRRFSGLAHYAIPRRMPLYLSKNEFAAYLGEYAAAFGLNVALGERVDSVKPAADTGRRHWVVETSAGERRARAVVIATGLYAQPCMPSLAGSDAFTGDLLHSTAYSNATAYEGKRVLVVGLGNSGAEIAADLAAHDAADVFVAVRTPPPIVSREMFGFVPVQLLGIALSPLGMPQIVDRVSGAMRRFTLGDLGRYGLRPAAWGPFSAQRPAVIDTGFIGQLKRGRITIRPAVDRLEAKGATYIDQTRDDVDAVIAATGFSTGLDRILSGPGLIDEQGRPKIAVNGGRNGRTDVRGLYFVGFTETVRGQLFEINRQSRQVATDIGRLLSTLQQLEKPVEAR